MNDFGITTPGTLHDELVKFSEALVPGAKPTYVRVSPSGRAVASQWFYNVAAERTEQRVPCYGWLIWEASGMWLEAERHAVMLCANDGLVDITPQQDGEEKIVFLRDPNWKFSTQNPKPTRRERWLLASDPETVNLVTSMTDYDKFRWRHSKFVGQQVYFNPLELSEKLQRQFSRLEQRVASAQSNFGKGRGL